MEEGIMGLNPQMGMPQTQNMNQRPRPQDLEAFEQARKQIPSEELSQTVLDSVEEQDPEVIGAFKELLQSIEMPEEVIMALKQLIRAVLQNPEMYPQLVDALMQLGADAEDIPPQFDPEFVSTLALSLDQVRKTTPMPEEVQGFADGGEVSMKPIAKYMASLGRNGDTILAHINPQEARLLKAFGGSGTINPQTGLPEFFFKKIFKSVKNAVDGVVKGAKKFLKSDVGRIVSAIAIGYFAGPYAAQAFGAKSFAAQAAATAFVGSTGSSFLAGDGVKNSVVNGAKTAAVAYATAPFVKAAFPTTGQEGTSYFDRVGQGFSSDADMAFPGFGEKEVAQGQKQGKLFETDFSDMKAKQDLVMRDKFGGIAQRADTATDVASGSYQAPFDAQRLGAEKLTGSTYGDATYGSRTLSDSYQPTKINVSNTVLRDAIPTSDTITDFDRNILGLTENKINPDLLLPGTDIPPPAGSQIAGLPPKDMTYGEYFTELGGGIKDLVISPFSKEATAREALSQIGRAAAAKPYTTTALGLIGANELGLLEGVKANPNLPGGFDQRGYELYMQDPEKYKSFFARPEISYYADRVRQMQEGGIAQNFPRKTGAINGPGTGTSDDIPAMLSDGEFVFTAKAVRNAGGGDRKKGANKMYSMMKSLERMG
tara:strand:- start:14642 stop:16603 length:1962 start_codon:yes stop_codon:yes gene_type:complete